MMTMPLPPFPPGEPPSAFPLPPPPPPVFAVPETPVLITALELEQFARQLLESTLPPAPPPPFPPAPPFAAQDPPPPPPA